MSDDFPIELEISSSFQLQKLVIATIRSFAHIGWNEIKSDVTPRQNLKEFASNAVGQKKRRSYHRVY